jgi:hypothetical protein
MDVGFPFSCTPCIELNSYSMIECWNRMVAFHRFLNGTFGLHNIIFYSVWQSYFCTCGEIILSCLSCCENVILVWILHIWKCHHYLYHSQIHFFPKDRGNFVLLEIALNWTVLSDGRKLFGSTTLWRLCGFIYSEKLWK